MMLMLAIPSAKLHSDNITPGNIRMKSISILDGLSSSNVTCISMDQDRHLWVGTDDGINVINNGHVFSFTQYSAEGDTLRSRVGNVVAMAVSNHKALVASDSDLLLFDNKTGRFGRISYNGRSMQVTAMTGLGSDGDSVYLFDSVSNSLFSASVSSGEIHLVRDFGENVAYRFGKILVSPEKNDILFLADDEKGVISMPISSGKITQVISGGEKIVAHSCIFDSDGRLWLSIFGKGLSAYSAEGRPEPRATFNKANSDLPSDYVNSVLELTDGHLMAVSTDAGVCIVNRDLRSIESITSHEAWFSTALFSDSPLELIFGTRFNGVQELRRTSLHFFANSNDASGFSLPDEMITSSLYGGNGELWLGTAGGGIYHFNEPDRRLDSFLSTRGNQITSMCSLDDRNLLVVSRFDGLRTFGKKDSKLVPYHLDCLDEITRDWLDFGGVLLSNAADGSVLVFNLDGRCCRIEGGRGTMFQLFPEDSEESILQVLPHKYTNVLVGNRRVYIMDNRDELWAKAIFSTNEDIQTATIDDDCNVWYITYSGVYRHILSTGETECVLPQNQDMRFVGIQCMGDQVWLSGRNRSIYCYSVKDKTVKAYTEEDGILPGNDFSSFSFKTDGACYFTGLEGIVSIIPAENPMPLRMQGFDVDCLAMAVDNKTARFEKDRFILPNKYNRAILIFSVVSPSAFTPAVFRYEIVDRSGHVITSSEVSDPVVSIGRLPSGEHSVRVSTFQGSGWQEYREIARINRVNDHLPVSLLVSILSFLLVVLGVFSYIRLTRNAREKSRMQEYMEGIRIRDRKGREEFTKNAIRVIRNQHSSIHSQLKDILDHGKVNPSTDKRLRDMLSKADRVDGWLESLQPIAELKKRNPVVKAVSIDGCLKPVVNDFQIDNNSEPKVEYVPMQAPLTVETDSELFSTAIVVFLANAFINRARNRIIVSSSPTNLGFVRVSVVDDGLSYPGDYDDLFDPSSEVISGDGFSSLGLAAARTGLEAIGCKVSGYRNVDNGGSTFYIDVPVLPARSDVEADKKAVQQSAKPDQDMDVPEIGEFENVTEMLDVKDFDTKDQTLLIVDDEADVRDYLSSVYSSRFKEIYLASDGKEGLEIAKEKQPGIIVSDVKMPGMNGFEFCKAVKSDIEISHLPFILLTSLAESKSQEIGYKMGADVFIPKPFDVKMLYNAIQTQLRNRYEIKKRYFSSALPEITEEQTFSAADEAFVLKLNKFINDNIGNPDLNIDMILSEMCVSRSTLFNKMNSIIGVSAARYIKNIRVERAKSLLAKTSMTVFEVASEVGFTESQYFSTVFKQETGLTPTQYRAQANR